MLKKLLIATPFILFSLGTLMAQQPSPYRMTYDDSTLQQQSQYTLMPFNRLIQSAGTVVTYENPLLENHTLDFAILPDSQHIAIEDRYGIAVLDIHSREITQRWTFQTETDPVKKGLMSTYSGIKSFSFDGHIYITWGAGNTRQSALI